MQEPGSQAWEPPLLLYPSGVAFGTMSPSPQTNFSSSRNIELGFRIILQSMKTTCRHRSKEAEVPRRVKREAV